jgi:hypothetical protein
MSPEAQLFLVRLAFISMGIIVFCSGIIRLYIEVRPRRWKKAEGTIIYAQAQIQQYRTHDGGQAAQVVPQIRFQYSWQGQTYCKDARLFTTGYETDANRLLMHFPIGKPIMVMINPKKPRMAEIEARITPASWLIILLGILLSGIAYLTW